MVQTWKTSKGEEVSCTTCKAKYLRSVWRGPTRDNDQAICGICGNEMESWNSTSVPMYSFIAEEEKE